MHIRPSHFLRAVAFLIALIVLSTAQAQAKGKPLTFSELMKFKQIRSAVISEDGEWVAYALVPDRGDGEVVVRSVSEGTEYRIPRGTLPQISADGRWAIATIEVPLEEKEKSKTKGKKAEKLKNGLVLVDLSDGSELEIENVEKALLSEDGRWLAYKHFREEKDEDKSSNDEEAASVETEAGVPGNSPEEPEAEPEEPEDKKKDKDLGATLKLRDLRSGAEREIFSVVGFSFDDRSSYLVYSVSAQDLGEDGLFAVDLQKDTPGSITVHRTSNGIYNEFTWAKDKSRLAFAAAIRNQEDKNQGAGVWTWQGSGEARQLVSAEAAPKGFVLPAKTTLTWSRDGERLFFGFALADRKPDEKVDEETEETEKESPPFDPYDLDSILEKRELDVWHWNDPRIVPNQKKQWQRVEKNRTYRAVVAFETGKILTLADLEMREVIPSDNARVVLGRADVPYLKEITWDGSYSDLYVVDLETGGRSLVRKHLSGWPSLSPGGRFVLFYEDEHWFLYDVKSKSTKNLTAGIGVSFANEDHDYPSDRPSYRHSEWISDESGVLIYDKYDVWQLSTNTGSLVNLTGGLGRENDTTFRVVDIDPDSKTLEPEQTILLSAYHDFEKHHAFYGARLGTVGVDPLYETKQHRVEFLAKAERADRLLFTRESYTEFPNLWVTNQKINNPQRISDANPQIADFAWGTPELVEWSSIDGTPLQGILIKPGNYEPGKRYPVLVYYYRFFSQRFFNFNEPVVNHRPSFPMYASNGYAVFLPDIRFEVGQPGFSATKCLVPGIQKLIEMGIADPEGIGLHGHSWSGYQTAFVITQTDIFSAAVAGAPVSNMTSAYSGIRLQTGLARQFQYEKSQSRIGGSLWEYPERYIENSPVFFADRINTPLLIQFGDEDGAVPWQQGIELYLACRRLEKNCIFLQYRGEPHHLKKYGNKLDYSIKMMEFFDHHLKGKPAPKWMTDGVPYQGE